MTPGETMIVGCLLSLIATQIMAHADDLFDRICAVLIGIGGLGVFITAIEKGALS